MGRQLPIEVRTPRLVLREWAEDDARTLVELVTANVEHLRPWMAWIADEPRSVDDRRADIRAWREKRNAGEEVALGVFLHDSTVIGGAGLHDRGRPATLEIGYWLSAAHTGQGYATELSDALTTAGLAVDGVEAIEITHDTANLASAAVPRRIAYRNVGDGRWRMPAAAWPTAQHRTPEPSAWLDEVLRSPSDNGTLTMLVRRPNTGEREVLTEGLLDVRLGLVGDNWSSRGSKSTVDGRSDPAAQLNVMNSRAARLVGGSEHRMPLVGDQLLIDLDISTDNLPVGALLQIGDHAVIEVTAKPHTGCAKFTQRFGLAAKRWTNAPETNDQRLRGLCATVIEPGTIRPGDRIHKW